MKSQDVYLLQCFAYENLPEEQQSICRPFHELAQQLFKIMPDCDERVGTLKKLLDAKEMAVRSTFKD